MGMQPPQPRVDEEKIHPDWSSFGWLNPYELDEKSIETPRPLYLGIVLGGSKRGFL